MHLLYLDESGSLTDPGQRYFVLAGVSIFERETHWTELELNRIASRFRPDDPHALEFHGSPMRTGKGLWRNVPREDRYAAIVEALNGGVCNRHPNGARLFGAVLEKEKYAGQDIAQVAFEQVSSRFDQFLGRLYKSKNDKQRGLILFDKSSTERRIQTLAREFKYSGHAFGKTRNFAEVPVFLDSEASRLIQLADLVAFSLFRHYEYMDSDFFNVIRSCFDAEGGVRHGLYIGNKISQ